MAIWSGSAQWGQYDFVSFALHQFGLAHLLTNTLNPSDVMYYTQSPGQQKRTFSNNDLNACKAIMANNALKTTFCTGASIMIPLTASNCTLGAPFADFSPSTKVICPGQSITFSNLSISNATNYAWTFEGGSPATSNLRVPPAISYASPGTYSVLLTSTNSSGSSTRTQYIAVISPQKPLPIKEDFEGKQIPSNWYVVDANQNGNTWQISKLAGQGESKQSLLVDNFKDLSIETNDELKTSVDLSGYASAKMTFYRAFPGGQYSMPLKIYASTDCDNTRDRIWYKVATTTSSTSQFFVPLSSDWKKDSVDLTPYVGQKSVIISFVNSGSGRNAFYLDNITISGTTAPPVASFTVDSQACTGQPINLKNGSSNSPTTWTWTATGASISSGNTASPSITYTTPGTYSITLNVANTDGSSTVTKTITVLPSPTLNVSGGMSICSGQSATLTASGAITYTWMPGNLFTATVTVNPGSTSNYSLSGSGTNGCASQTLLTVSITPTPSLAIQSATTCAGLTATLTASGATSYTWMPGGAKGPSFTDAPNATSIYTVTGTNGQCAGIGTGTIIIGTQLGILATGTTICTGQGATLTATGATNYTWSPGALTGATVFVSPAVNTTYTVDGASTGCKGSTQVNVTLLPLPVTPTIKNDGYTLMCTPPASAYQWYFNAAPIANATDSSYAAAQDGIYSVVTKSSAGCESLHSNTIAVIGTEVEALAKEEMFLSVVPNPNEGTFSIHTNLKGTYNLQLYNAIGQTVHQQTIDTASTSAVHIEHLEKGIYYLQIVQEMTLKTMKVLIQ